MWRALKEFFDIQTGETGAASSGEARHAHEVAAAALLVEITRIDGAMQETERAAVLRAIHDKFGLSADEAEELLALAEREVSKAEGYYPFTSLINRNFSQEQKEFLIELMWRAAYADKELSAHELHLMRKVAGLLHISDNAYIVAKLRAKQAAEGS